MKLKCTGTLVDSRVNYNYKWSWGVFHVYNVYNMLYNLYYICTMYVKFMYKKFFLAPRNSPSSQSSSSFFKLTHNTHTTPTALINIPHVRQRHHGTLAALIDCPHQC